GAAQRLELLPVHRRHPVASVAAGHMEHHTVHKRCHGGASFLLRVWSTVLPAFTAHTSAVSPRLSSTVAGSPPRGGKHGRTATNSTQQPRPVLGAHCCRSSLAGGGDCADHHDDAWRRRRPRGAIALAQ